MNIEKTLRYLAFAVPLVPVVACSADGGEKSAETRSAFGGAVGGGVTLPPACVDGFDATTLPQYEWSESPFLSPWTPSAIYGHIDFPGQIVWEHAGLGKDYEAFLAVDVGAGGSGPPTAVAIVYVLLGDQDRFVQYNPSAHGITTFVGGGPCPGHGGGSGQDCYVVRASSKPDVSCVPNSLLSSAVDNYVSPVSCDGHFFCAPPVGLP